MKVKCVRTKVSEFPFKDEAHLAYFRGWLGAGKIKRGLGFESLSVGKIYVVYAVRSYSGYPFYFVKTSEQGFGYRLQPGPCFEIVDTTLSKLWHYKNDVHVAKNGEETFDSILAIREWIEDDGFLNWLIDGKPREMEIWAEAAKKIESEG